jgi:hypothetical protein
VKITTRAILTGIFINILRVSVWLYALFILRIAVLKPADAPYTETIRENERIFALLTPVISFIKSRAGSLRESGRNDEIRSVSRTASKFKNPTIDIRNIENGKTEKKSLYVMSLAAEIKSSFFTAVIILLANLKKLFNFCFFKI